jgi:hypothetical protein
MDLSIVAEKYLEARPSELLALKSLREHEAGIARVKTTEVGHDHDPAADIHTENSRLGLRSLLWGSALRLLPNMSLIAELQMQKKVEDAVVLAAYQDVVVLMITMIMMTEMVDAAGANTKTQSIAETQLPRLESQLQL